MNSILNLINNLNYRVFFYFIIPISFVAMWIVKYYEMFEEAIIQGAVSLTLYIIGGFWLLLFVAYKTVMPGKSANWQTNSKKVTLTDIFSSEHLNFVNYQKSVFYAWMGAILTSLCGITAR